MEINEKFSITRDSYNFVVEEIIENDTKRSNTKNRTRTTKRYYKNLELACLCVLKLSTDVQSVEKCLESQRKVADEIIVAVNKLDKGKRELIFSD